MSQSTKMVNGFNDEDGCPEVDSDGDTLFDEVDKCAKQQKI